MHTYACTYCYHYYGNEEFISIHIQSDSFRAVFVYCREDLRFSEALKFVCVSNLLTYTSYEFTYFCVFYIISDTVHWKSKSMAKMKMISYLVQSLFVFLSLEVIFRAMSNFSVITTPSYRTTRPDLCCVCKLQKLVYFI